MVTFCLPVLPVSTQEKHLHATTDEFTFTLSCGKYIFTKTANWEIEIPEAAVEKKKTSEKIINISCP